MNDMIEIPIIAPLVLIGSLLSLVITLCVFNTIQYESGTSNIAYAKEMTRETLPIIVSEEPIELEPTLTREEIELIAVMTMAEAEGEDEMGKRLVIDTILNRVDSEVGYFPDTVHDVIYQTNAFEPVSNGRMDRCYVTDEILQLVYEELENRTNYDVVYFTAGEYNPYGTPLFQHGNHYFSGH